MIFTDRTDAGTRLAHRLSPYSRQPDVVVLGIPRGGIPVAYQVASFLHAPLEIFLAAKLGVPGQEELAFGALAAGDGCFLDERVIEASGLTPTQIQNVKEATQQKLDQRAALYCHNRPPLLLEGKTVLLVDDGIATGASIYAAIQALRHMHPARIVVATPVAPISTCHWLRTVADEVVAVHEPLRFYAVGEFYDHFPQVSDDEVIALLARAQPKAGPARATPEHPRHVFQHELTLPLASVSLPATLTIPPDAAGIVLFAHGSGSSRHSPRNRFVADVLQRHQLATLLFDLLTPQEDAIDRATTELRFHIALLAQRLVGVTQWAAKNPGIAMLPIGYFGASTGAAAALVAAARLPGLIAAVVSRGGRPDLAAEDLARVQAPTLLLVGARDETVVALNRVALSRLGSKSKELVLIPDATHLFEEAGALEEVSRRSAAWLHRYLLQARRQRQDEAEKVS